MSKLYYTKDTKQLVAFSDLVNYNLKDLIGTEFTPEDVFIEVTTGEMRPEDLEKFMNSLSSEQLDELYQAVKQWRKSGRLSSSDELACKKGAEKVGKIADKFFKGSKNFSDRMNSINEKLSSLF